jgi:hypothetical protein
LIKSGVFAAHQLGVSYLVLLSAAFPLMVQRRGTFPGALSGAYFFTGEVMSTESEFFRMENYVA